MIEIEISTRDQNECQKWFQEWKLRLTSSNLQNEENHKLQK